jgi:hypothetical protein
VVNFLLEHGKNFLEALALGSLAWIALMLMLTPLNFGAPGFIRLALSLRKLLRQLPSTSVFESDGKILSTTTFIPAQGREVTTVLLRLPPPSLLVWRDGQKRATRAMRERINREVAWRGGCLLISLPPFLAITIWLAQNYSWQWLYVSIFLILHQIFLWKVPCFYFPKPGVVIGLTSLTLWAGFSGLISSPWRNGLFAFFVYASFPAIWVLKKGILDE